MIHEGSVCMASGRIMHGAGLGSSEHSLANMGHFNQDRESGVQMSCGWILKPASKA
jgi:hypothetical protein